MQEVDRVLGEQNPWHLDGEVPTVLAPPVERALARQLWPQVLADDPRRFHLVLGPRRVGKTTAMYQTVRHLTEARTSPERLWWLRMDHPVLLRESLGELVGHVIEVSEAGSGREAVLLLDELVYADQWDLWLKTFYDDRWPVRVVATSSATAALRGRRVESGVGRWSEHFLMPYLFSEYLDLLGRLADVEVGPTLADTLSALPRIAPPTDLESLRRRFLLVGGFPELIARDRAREGEPDVDRLLVSQQVLRNDAVERAIYKDIPQSFGIDHPMIVERLLYILAGQVTGILSPNSICAELDNLSQPTFDRYVSYLEQTFLVFRLTNFSGTEAAVQKRGRKVYFHDGAVRSAALQRALAPLTDPVEMGVLLENLAAASLHTLAVHEGTRLHHWRDGKDEVDLVLDHSTQPLAFEIGPSARHSARGLVALQQRHRRFAGRCYLVAPDAPVRRPDESTYGVGALPLDRFLVAVGRQAERALDLTLTAPTAPGPDAKLPS
ncbi:MAG: ATP-binding protein [Sporichthyaceae bacterium]|nr:ATP-binding protein [Sporichthyaceae bacterium]